MRLIAFDLDDTLAPSKSPLPPQMDVALRSLLDHVEVCIISGGQMGQFRTQVLDNLHASDEELSRLHLMPTCGTRYYRFEDGAWVERYAHDLDPEVAARVIESLERHARELGLWEENPWGNIIEDRGSQITFSALGQEAPLDAKRAWDPDGTKKAALRDAVQPDVPELDVRGGGSTSVDITTRGIDKAYGMGKLVEETGIPASEMLFIGDRLDPEGNDYPVKGAGPVPTSTRSIPASARVEGRPASPRASRTSGVMDSAWCRPESLWARPMTRPLSMIATTVAAWVSRAISRTV